MMTEIDPEEFFKPGFINSQQTEKPAAKNEFAGIEGALGLPDGSTKEGLAIVKEQAKAISKRTNEIKAEAKSLAAKEKLATKMSMPALSPEVLKADRERIRQEAWEVYESSKNFLQMLEERIMSTIAPSDKIWSAAATMVNSVSTAISKLVEVNTKLRLEAEHAAEVEERQLGPGENNGKQTFTFTPDKMNEFIESWSSELDDEVNEQLKQEQEQKMLPNYNG